MHRRNPAARTRSDRAPRTLSAAAGYPEASGVRTSSVCGPQLCGISEEVRPEAEAGCVPEDLRAGLSLPCLYTWLCLHPAPPRPGAWPERAALVGGECAWRPQTRSLFCPFPFPSPQAGSLGPSLFLYTRGPGRAASGCREHPPRRLEKDTVPLMQHPCEDQGCPTGPVDHWFRRWVWGQARGHVMGEVPRRGSGSCPLEASGQCLKVKSPWEHAPPCPCPPFVQ